MKTHKNKFKRRLGILSGIILFAALSLGVFAYVAPETFTEVVACLTSTTGISTAMVFLPTMAIQRKEGDNPGGGVMTAEAKAALFNEIKTQCKTDIDAFVKANPDIVAMLAQKQKIDDLEAKLKDVKLDDVKAIETLKTEVSQALVAIQALKDTSVGGDRAGKKNSFYDTLIAHKGQMEKFAKKEIKTLEIEHKTNTTVTSTDIDGRENWFTWHQGGSVGQLAVRKPFLRELMTNIPTGSEYVKYVDQETVTRGAANVALCGTSNSTTAITWKARDMKVEKVRDYIMICQDMMDDYAFVGGEIQNLLNTSLQLKIDDNFLNGNNSSPNSQSIDNVASTFSAAGSNAETDYTNSVMYATLIDLISVMGAQIRSFGLNNMFNPNIVLLNPRDAQLMKLLKDSQRNYIKGNTLRPSLIQGANSQWYVDGMLVVENSNIPANECYVFDSTKATIYSRPGVGIEFAYQDGTNFQQELVTVKVYERLNMLVRNVDLNAFLHCTANDVAIQAIGVFT